MPVLQSFSSRMDTNDRPSRCGVPDWTAAREPLYLEGVSDLLPRDVLRVRFSVQRTASTREYVGDSPHRDHGPVAITGLVTNVASAPPRQIGRLRAGDRNRRHEPSTLGTLGLAASFRLAGVWAATQLGVPPHPARALLATLASRCCRRASTSRSGSTSPGATTGSSGSHPPIRLTYLGVSGCLRPWLDRVTGPRRRLRAADPMQSAGRSDGTYMPIWRIMEGVKEAVTCFDCCGRLCCWEFWVCSR